MKSNLLKKARQIIYFSSIVVFISLSTGNNTFAQTRELNVPEVEYTTLEDYYSTGAEIACTARVYSNGLIDQLCSIYYEIYKDDFDTPITSVSDYGSISYTVRSQGTDYVTQQITEGHGYLSVANPLPWGADYLAFTLGLFDNYCVARNRPVALSLTFDEPGVYKFNAEIQSCSNSGSSLFSSYTTNGAPGCDTDSHTDYAASSCSNPTTLFSEAIFLTICDDNFISFLSGATEYCPGAEINLVYNIGEYDDAVDMTLLPTWISPVIDQNANTLTLTGTAPDYDSENPIITFDVRILSTTNPVGCPGAIVNQSITITNAQKPVISGDNMICEDGTVFLTSDIAATWSSSDTEIATIEQTAPDTEVTITPQNLGTTIITCQEFISGCDLISDEFNFTVNANYEITLTESICDGESYPFGADNLDTAGDYNLNTTSQYGCDSIVHLTLQVNELSNTEFYIEGESYTWNTIEYTESGDYIQTFSDINGCDSTVTLHFTFACDECLIEFSSGNTEYCPGAAINIIYNIGEYNDSVDMALLPAWVVPIIDQNANTLTLTGNAPAYDTENPTINFDVRILITTSPAICPGATINQSITIIDAATPIISGDNIMCEGGTITLTSDIAATWSSSNTEVATIEQTAPDTEVTVTSYNSGTTIITCQITDNTCDVTSNNFIVTVNEKYETILAETICDEETFEWQGETYSETGTYYAEYISEFGCDSIYELNLIVNPIYSIQEEAAICDGDSYLFGEEELNIAGEYTLTIPSQYGCDSIVHLILQVNELSTSEFYIEDESYTWNTTEYTESGDYVQTFSDVNGCDSTVTLHLTIITDIASYSISKETINVYPNPVNENLNIDITRQNNTTYSIILTDITGKVLIMKDHASENNILDLSQISGGIYFISVMSDNKIIFTNMINKE